MEPQKYIQTQILILEIGKVTKQLDLENFLAAISSAEAVTPMLDPTMYRKAAGNLAVIKKLAEALVPVKDAFDEAFETILKTAVHAKEELGGN